MNLLMNLAYASPLLIVDLVTVILGIVNLSKHKAPALLALFGGMLNLFTTIGWHVIFSILTSSDDARGTWVSVISITSSVAHAGAWLMVVLAVFAGRKKVSRDDDDDDRPRRSRRDDPPVARPSRPTD